jgi:hypothetical protein
MPVLRHAVAVVPLAALAIGAPSAHAAAVQTLPCVPYIAGEKTMPIVAGGFTPGSFLRIYTTTTANPTPRILASSRLDGTGGFHAATAPPSFTKANANLEAFTLIAADETNPGAPILASFPFQVVRFGMTRRPAPKRPRQRVTITARGFIPGKPVYAHFRFAGKTRRTVNLGVAKPPCGITSKRMRALPTKVRYGGWRAYIDQARRFSAKTRPQWIDQFTIFRTIR